MHPFLIGGERSGTAFAKPNRRCAIGIPNINSVSQILRISILHAAANSLFIEKKGLAVGGKIGRIGIVKPGKISLFGCALIQRHDLAPTVGASQQDASIAPDIEHNQRPGTRVTNRCFPMR